MASWSGAPQAADLAGGIASLQKRVQIGDGATNGVGEEKDGRDRRKSLSRWRRGGMMERLPIRTRLILLSGALLFFLFATNFYLNRRLAENSAGMAKAVALLGVIREANEPYRRSVPEAEGSRLKCR